MNLDEDAEVHQYFCSTALLKDDARSVVTVKLVLDRDGCDWFVFHQRASEWLLEGRYFGLHPPIPRIIDVSLNTNSIEAIKKRKYDCDTCNRTFVS